MLSDNIKPFPALLGDIVDQMGHLIGTEIRLAQAELSEKIEEARRGVAFLIAAGVVMIPAIVMLLLALAQWLVQIGVAAPASYLMSASIGGVLSILLLVSGLSRLNLKRLKLKKTVHQINQDIAAARNLAR